VLGFWVTTRAQHNVGEARARWLDDFVTEWGQSSAGAEASLEREGEPRLEEGDKVDMWDLHVNDLAEGRGR
jgi:hypothetical protein